MTLKDKFAGMAMEEPIKIEIEGEELQLDMRVDDIVPLMSMGTKQGDISEDDVETLTETFRTVLYRSYLPWYDGVRDQEPNNLSEERKEENEEMKEFIDGMLLRKLPQLINKIVEELGWNDGVDLEGDFPEQGNRQA